MHRRYEEELALLHLHVGQGHCHLQRGQGEDHQHGRQSFCQVRKQGSRVLIQVRSLRKFKWF